MSGNPDQTASRTHGGRSPDGQHTVRSIKLCARGIKHFLHQRLAKHHRIELHSTTAIRTRSRCKQRHEVCELSARATLNATQTLPIAMYLDEPFRRQACPRIQPIYILRDDCLHPAIAHQPSQRVMPRMRLSGLQPLAQMQDMRVKLSVHLPLPVRLRIGLELAETIHARTTKARPKAIAATKRRDTRLDRHPSTGHSNNILRPTDQVRNLVNRQAQSIINRTNLRGHCTAGVYIQVNRTAS